MFSAIREVREHVAWSRVKCHMVKWPGDTPFGGRTIQLRFLDVVNRPFIFIAG